MFMENLPKKGPLSREFWAQKPNHMGGTYPYPQHVMYPPPPGPELWLIFWPESNCNVILVNHDSLILLKQRCNLGQHLVYPVVLDTIVFKDSCPRTATL